MENVDIIIANAKELYKDLMYQNAKDFKAIRSGSFAGAKAYLKERAEKNGEKYSDGYVYALDWVNLISPRYYIQGVDITLAMREKIWLDDYGADDESWELVKEALREYEEECFKEYINCVIGVPSKPDGVYDNYVKCVKEMNSFLGVPNAMEPQVENTRAFRVLVKNVIHARKKCQVVVSFTSLVIPPEKRIAYNKNKLSFEDALEICQDIIDNVSKIAYTKKGQTLVDACVETEEIRGILVYGGVDNKECSKGLKKQIMENFVTNYIEDCGVLPELYKKYFKSVGYFPNKKLAIALGLYLEPYADLSKNKSLESCIEENLEAFLSQNCLSINSNFATVTEYDVLLDNDLKMMLEDGLPLDMIAYMLKTYARTEKDFNKIKKADNAD